MKILKECVTLQIITVAKDAGRELVKMLERLRTVIGWLAAIGYILAVLSIFYSVAWFLEHLLVGTIWLAIWWVLGGRKKQAVKGNK